MRSWQWLGLLENLREAGGFYHQINMIKHGGCIFVSLCIQFWETVSCELRAAIPSIFLPACLREMRVAVPSATRKLGPHIIFMTNPEAIVWQWLEGSWDTNSATSASFDRHARKSALDQYAGLKRRSEYDGKQ